MAVAGEPVAVAGHYAGPATEVALRWLEDPEPDFFAKLDGELEASGLRIAGELSLHLNRVAGGYRLLVVFDHRSSLGLVRLRVKKALFDLERVIVG